MCPGVYPGVGQGHTQLSDRQGQLHHSQSQVRRLGSWTAYDEGASTKQSGQYVHSSTRDSLEAPESGAVEVEVPRTKEVEVREAGGESW